MRSFNGVEKDETEILSEAPGKIIEKGFAELGGKLLFRYFYSVNIVSPGTVTNKVLSLPESIFALVGPK